MCGIAGAMTAEPRRGDLLSPMIGSLQHRGPDGTRTLFLDQSGPVEHPAVNSWRACLGHARLALVGSHGSGLQPSSTATGVIVSAVNGEIYNYLDLKADLARQGIPVTGDSDCDVVPYVYEQRGITGLADLEGVFSGVVIDLRKMEVVLFKDRFGARPIYYTINDTGIFFSSEIKALLTLDSVRVDLNRRAAVEYFTFQSSLRRHTFFTGIDTLMPGEVLTYRNDRTEICNLPDRRNSYAGLSFRDAVALTREVLDKSVVRQWRPDSSAYLSGGIDSNAIVSCLSYNDRRPRTYTATFSSHNLKAYDQDADESPLASALAGIYGVEHEKIVLTAEDFAKAVPRIIWHTEDIQMPISFGAWEISRRASEHNPVIYSGMGGDELFAGYVDRIAALAPADASDADWLSSYGSMWERRMLSADERVHALTLLGTKSELRQEPFDALREQFDWARERYKLGPVRRLLALERSFYLPGLLIVDDRMSMAHGVETRVPLIDDGLADIANTAPENYLLRDGTGKLLLRKALADRVPHPVAEKPKQPFRVPEATWYRYDLAAWLNESLLGKNSCITEFVTPDFISDVLHAHISGAENRRRVIWSLLSFEFWCRVFLRGDIPSAAANARDLESAAE
jgi:asparagine synthase (glutamine-hydrolysing)